MIMPPFQTQSSDQALHGSRSPVALLTCSSILLHCRASFKQCPCNQHCLRSRVGVSMQALTYPVNSGALLPRFWSSAAVLACCWLCCSVMLAGAPLAAG